MKITRLVGEQVRLVVYIGCRITKLGCLENEAVWSNLFGENPNIFCMFLMEKSYFATVLHARMPADEWRV